MVQQKPSFALSFYMNQDGIAGQGDELYDFAKKYGIGLTQLNAQIVVR